MSQDDKFTLDEVRRTLARMDQALAAIAAHLKDLNGSVAKHATAIALAETKIRNVEREVFRADRQAPPSIPAELAAQLATLVSAITSDNAPALTRRDVAVLGAAGKAVWAVVGAIVAAAALLIAKAGV